MVEDDIGVCGYAVGAMNAQQLHEKSMVAWIPVMREKYPLIQKQQPSPADVSSPLLVLPNVLSGFDSTFTSDFEHKNL